MLLVLLAPAACRNRSNPAPQAPLSDSAAGPAFDPASLPAPRPPAGWEKFDEASGDLDRDGQAELVVGYNTAEQGDFGAVRRLIIYKAGRGSWNTWHESGGPLLGSDDGGQLGDPFQSMTVENGAIVLRQAGGSRDRWNFLHRYRRNGDR